MPDTAIQPYPSSHLMPALEHATVADAMHPGILSRQTDAPLTEVARMMATHHVHSIAVMHAAHDDSGEPYVCGVVSDLDLVRAGVGPAGEESAGALVRQPTMALRDAAELCSSMASDIWS
jgi:CBS domain-containing protein